MGYRNYIGYLPKEEYEKIKNFSYEEVYDYFAEKNKTTRDEDEDLYVGVYTVAYNELYSFGKYAEFGDRNFYKPVFLNVETQKDFEDEHDFYIIDKSFLKHIIEHYQEKIKIYYINLVGNEVFDIKSFKNAPDERVLEWYNHCTDLKFEWINDFAIDLNEENKQITGSWKYEYSIFELVKIYKCFDWENNVVIYYGY